jgi:hypothetical protein
MRSLPPDIRQLKRELVSGCECGRPSGNYQDISNIWLAHGFLSSNPLCPARQSGLFGAFPGCRKVHDISAGYPAASTDPVPCPPMWHRDPPGFLLRRDALFAHRRRISRPKESNVNGAVLQGFARMDRRKPPVEAATSDTKALQRRPRMVVRGAILRALSAG